LVHSSVSEDDNQSCFFLFLLSPMHACTESKVNTHIHARTIIICVFLFYGQDREEKEREREREEKEKKKVI
jgi:hypothetical protein